MPNFSRRSLLILETCDVRLQSICHQAIEIMDFSVIDGARDKEEQNVLFDQGLSLVKYPHSKHNRTPSKAVDLAPYPIDWRDIERFRILGQIITLDSTFQQARIIWGGWWTWKDWGHFELL